jgi:hypothetical protein
MIKTCFAHGSLALNNSQKEITQSEGRRAKIENVVKNITEITLNPQEQAEVEENAFLALETIDHVLGIIKYSNTLGADTLSELKTIFGRVQQCRKEWFPIPKTDLLSRVGIIEKHQAGNCDEMAKVGFVYLFNKTMGKNNLAFGVWSILRHTFLIIGTQGDVCTSVTEGESETYCAFFGKTAVICDPWAGKVYHVSNINAMLEDYIGLNENLQPKTQPFRHKPGLMRDQCPNYIFPCYTALYQKGIQ